ncbi:bifunctional tetrahydrofolate synthase/dihydrofolate synthase [Oligella urethralis]|uniref:bifunctional tetrahydrofolate synthase/dihydrofolate synthase n=1 Tax=Oligella urethralis TaxID=90245 RepID=UPI00288A9F7B|nr:bifunctional tetrahydrofolate synthase/dihydrofolate synthase [Oligella urethralis]
MSIIPTSHSSLSTWLSYLEHLHRQEIDLGLDRIKQVAARLPIELDSIKIVVGGTNGKGSTCAMLESIYLAAGYRVGLYTSPHLIRFNERIRLNGLEASDQQIVEQLAIIEEARGDISLSYFEYTTLAAILLFKANDIQVSIFEVGLGGRLDAVNIIDADCSIITSIAIDHINYLGDTRDQIAWEKAHIYRQGKVAICADPEPPQSLIDYAQEIGADLQLFGRDFNYTGDQIQWTYIGKNQRRHALAYPALRGANQLINAAAALTAVEALKMSAPVPNQSIREGLLRVELAGRFQILPGQPTTVLDVAHNPHAAAVLQHNLHAMSYFPYTTAVFGMLDDKDVSQVIKCLEKTVDYWYCASLSGTRGVSGQALADKINSLISKDKDGLPEVRVFDSPHQAYEAAKARSNPEDRIVVFGSFLTVADVLAHLPSSN